MPFPVRFGLEPDRKRQCSQYFRSHTVYFPTDLLPSQSLGLVLKNEIRNSK